MLFDIGITVSGDGPGTVAFPVYSTDSSRTTINTEGNINVELDGEKRRLRFAEFKKIRRKSDGNWVTVQLRRDDLGIDVVFGRSAGGSAHSHYSYSSWPRMLLFRSEDDTQLQRKIGFDSADGTYVPIQDRIDDKGTGMSLILEFSVINAEVGIKSTRFFRTDT